MALNKEERIERDRALCALYATGTSLTECARQFGLRKQRTLQILKCGGVWRRQVRGRRTTYLGVQVTAETREALRQRAEAAGVSSSRFTSDLLDAAVKS